MKSIIFFLFINISLFYSPKNFGQKDKIYDFKDSDQLQVPKEKSTDWKAGPKECMQDLTPVESREKFAQELIKNAKWQEAAWIYARLGQQDKEILWLKKLEEEMGKAEIISKGPLGGGVSETHVVKFPSGIKAVFKPEGPTQYINTEIAAYKIDRILGLNIVPMTIERTIEGKKGSLQYFIKDAKMGGQVGKPVITPKMALFDYLIANRDRSERNYLVLNDPRFAYHRQNFTDQVAIDHNLGLIIKKPGIDYPGDALALAHVGKDFCQRLEQLGEPILRQYLKNDLSEFQFKMLFENRLFLLQKPCVEYKKMATCSR